MWFLRLVLRIAWVDKVTNEKVLHRANFDRKLVNDIVNRQMSFFGHVIRKDAFENLVVTGFVEKRENAAEGTYLTYLQNRKDLTPMELIHFAYERDGWFELSK